MILSGCGSNHKDYTPQSWAASIEQSMNDCRRLFKNVASNLENDCVEFGLLTARMGDFIVK